MITDKNIFNAEVASDYRNSKCGLNLNGLILQSHERYRIYFAIFLKRIKTNLKTRYMVLLWSRMIYNDIPLVIYDDTCTLCLRCARLVHFLSRGKINIEGHYYSIRTARIKKEIFPFGYDPTGMFWFINKNGAYGARAGLFELFKEIIRINLFQKKANQSDPASVEMQANTTINSVGQCSTWVFTIRRLLSTIRNSKTFPFSN